MLSKHIHCHSLSLRFTYSLLFLTCIVESSINLPKNITIPAVIAFGDSIFDTGINNYIITLAKCDFPPYGINFMGAKATGRYSDGKVPPDLIVEELGIKPLLPPYLDPSLQPQDLLTGVSFASGGSGYDPSTNQLARVLSLPDQLELFQDYIQRLKKIAGEERTSKILKESLIVVATGTNDITHFNGLSLKQLQYDIPSYIELLVSYASSFVQELHNLGAGRIVVFGLTPFGCLPSQRTLKGGLERKCFEEYNLIAQQFNEKLSAALSSINTQFPEAVMDYGDLYNITHDIIQNPQKYGFKIGNRGCCGTGLIEVTFTCTYACSNVSEYVFWDSFHPIEKAYRIIVHDSLKKLFNNFV